MRKTVDLGFCIAALEDESPYQQLTIVSPSQLGDAFCPSESVVIGGKQYILALRDFLNSAYPLSPNS